MRLLLDTHVFIWMMTDADKLSSRARLALADADNERLLSSASVWEMAIKAGLKKLELDLPLAEFVQTGLKKGQIDELPVRISQTLVVESLPPHHRDPFDRLLIAQAQAESLMLVTADPLMSQYDVTTLW